MDDDNAPHHAHIYDAPETRALAESLRRRLLAATASGEIRAPLFVGRLRDRRAGPHPVPQFETRFPHAILPLALPLLEGPGLTVLVQPPTDDDLGTQEG